MKSISLAISDIRNTSNTIYPLAHKVHFAVEKTSTYIPLLSSSTH